MPIAICLVAIFAQQAMVALTTVAIAQSAAILTGGGDPLPQLTVFCVLLLAGNLPDIFIDLERERSKYWLFNKAISRSAKANYGATGTYFNKRIRQEKEPYIDTELWITISDNVAYAADLFATLANIVLNTAAVASVLDASFAIALGAAGIISLVSSGLAFSLIGHRTKRAQAARAKLFSAIRLCIPNAWIGNARNFRDWKEHFNETHSDSMRAQSALSLTRCSLASLTAIMSAVPFIAATMGYATAHVSDLPAMTALIAVLPRQVSILQYMNIVVAYAAQLSERIARTRLVYSNLVLTPEERNTGGSIRWNEMQLCPEGGSTTATHPNSIADIEASTHDFSNGRITIRGTNGCGKSTLLAHLKETLGDRAYLLPANPALFFPMLSGKEASSGQTVSRILDLIEADYLDDGVSVVLLDEWDANLDEKMRGHHDKKLDELAHRKCIIEVLHNKHGRE